LVLAGGLIWVNYQFALNDAGGRDFAPLWLGMRLHILEEQNPYGEETLADIQSFLYGGRMAYSWENRGWFLYPYYAMLVFSPTAMISDFAMARAVWMTLLAAALIGITFVSLELTRWSPSRVVLAGYLVFVLGGYYAVRPVYNGNPSIMSALCIVLTFLFIQRERDVAAGILLGLSTFKPQMVILLWWFVLLWAVSHRRLGLILSMTITPILLAVGSSFLQPGWLALSLAEMIEYVKNNGPMTFGGILNERWPGSGGVVGGALTVALAILLIVEWWRALGKDLRWFFWTAGLTLAITNMIGIPTGTSNHIALIPVLVFVFSIWEQRWGGFGRNLILICMLGVLGGLWWLYLETTGIGPGLSQSPIMFFPLPVFVFIMLYWIRYWALGALRLQTDKFEALKNL
jgi:hypothetical protein